MNESCKRIKCKNIFSKSRKPHVTLLFLDHATKHSESPMSTAVDVWHVRMWREGQQGSHSRTCVSPGQVRAQTREPYFLNIAWQRFSTPSRGTRLFISVITSLSCVSAFCPRILFHTVSLSRVPSCRKWISPHWTHVTELNELQRRVASIMLLIEFK